MGKRCTHCCKWCDDKEFGLTIRMRNTNVLEEGETTKGKVAYLKSWCKACTNRNLRLTRGTGTDLDILTNLEIKLRKDYENSMRVYPKESHWFKDQPKESPPESLSDS